LLSTSFVVLTEVSGIPFSLYMVLNTMLCGALEQGDVEPIGPIGVRPISFFIQELIVCVVCEESFDLFFSF